MKQFQIYIQKSDSKSKLYLSTAVDKYREAAEMKIELFLGGKRWKKMRKSVRNFISVIGRKKSVPKSIGISSRSESGGNRSGAANVLRRSEREYVRNTAFGKSGEVERRGGVGEDGSGGFGFSHEIVKWDFEKGEKGGFI